MKLIAYLESFHLGSEDLQFHDEKRLLIETLHGLEEIELHKTQASSNKTENGSNEKGLEESVSEMSVKGGVNSADKLGDKGTGHHTKVDK